MFLDMLMLDLYNRHTAMMLTLVLLEVRSLLGVNDAAVLVSILCPELFHI
jgi:hypothetical protein